MEQPKPLTGPTLAELDDPEELKRRYEGISDQVLIKWSQAVTGAHRDAMLEVLREREFPGTQENI